MGYSIYSPAPYAVDKTHSEVILDMRKNIIAIVLVFALAFGFASCKQLEKTDMFTIESQVYIVDDEGVTRNVQTRIKENGEVEYFYIDSDGNTIFVKKDDVVIETKRVLASTTDSNTFSPEAQSFLDAFNDPSSLDELIDTKVTEPKLDMADGLVPDDGFKQIEPVTGADGKPQRETFEKNFKEIIKSESFTLSATIEAEVDGSTVRMPITLMRSGDDLYAETNMPVEGKGALKAAFVVTGGKLYLVIPAMRCYMEVPQDVLDTILDPDLIEGGANDDNSKYVSSAEVTVGGKKYTCDVYESDGDTTKYYFDSNGDLKRIESISSDGSPAIIEISTLKKGADKSKMKIPSGYFDMTKIMGENFDYSTLT